VDACLACPGIPKFVEFTCVSTHFQNDDPVTTDGLSMCGNRNSSLAGLVLDGYVYLNQAYMPTGCPVLAWNSVNLTLTLTNTADYASGDYFVTLHTYYDSYRTDTIFCLDLSWTIA